MKYDAIIVPGGGVRQGGELPPWARQRFDLAMELHEGAPIIALSAGTPHRPPPLDGRGFPILESLAGAQYLLRAGVPGDLILAETHSWDTIGNAWFSRVIHAEPRGFRRLLVITSEFHMPRTEMVFRWVYALAPLVEPYSLSFQSVSDEEIDGESCASRMKKERRSMEALMPLIETIRNQAAFHRWLFTEHDAYNAEAKAFHPNPAADDQLY